MHSKKWCVVFVVQYSVASFFIVFLREHELKDVISKTETTAEIWLAT